MPEKPKNPTEFCSDIASDDADARIAELDAHYEEARRRLAELEKHPIPDAFLLEEEQINLELAARMAQDAKEQIAHKRSR